MSRIYYAKFTRSGRLWCDGCERAVSVQTTEHCLDIRIFYPLSSRLKAERNNLAIRAVYSGVPIAATAVTSSRECASFSVGLS